MGVRLLVVAVAVVLAGCAGIPLPDAIGGPIIVEGVFVDPTGAPISNAEVVLSVNDLEVHDNPGGAISTLYELHTTTDGAGRFVFRGPPSPEVMAYVDGGPVVSLDLTGLDPRGGDGVAGTVHRGIDGSMWTGDPPTIELRVPPS